MDAVHRPDGRMGDLLMKDPSAPPLRLGNYEPLLELASGGMATVYIARQLGAAGFERIVVVKRVHRHLLGNREFYDMFRDEARVASMVRHPNVVPVIDVVEIRGAESNPESELFLVMEYVESCSLATLRKAAHEYGGRLPVPIVARVIYDALAGLHAAHQAVDMQGQPLGVVHRDVSPQNVIVGVDGFEPAHRLRRREGLTPPHRDEERQREGQVQLHGARAGAWAGGRSAHGHLRRGRRAPRVPHG